MAQSRSNRSSIDLTTKKNLKSSRQISNTSVTSLSSSKEGKDISKNQQKNGQSNTKPSLQYHKKFHRIIVSHNPTKSSKNTDAYDSQTNTSSKMVSGQKPVNYLLDQHPLMLPSPSFAAKIQKQTQSHRQSEPNSNNVSCLVACGIYKPKQNAPKTTFSPQPQNNQIIPASSNQYQPYLQPSVFKQTALSRMQQLQHVQSPQPHSLQSNIMPPPSSNHQSNQKNSNSKSHLDSAGNSSSALNQFQPLYTKKNKEDLQNKLLDFSGQTQQYPKDLQCYRPNFDTQTTTTSSRKALGNSKQMKNRNNSLIGNQESLIVSSRQQPQQQIVRSSRVQNPTNDLTTPPLLVTPGVDGTKHTIKLMPPLNLQSARGNPTGVISSAQQQQMVSEPVSKTTRYQKSKALMIHQQYQQPQFQLNQLEQGSSSYLMENSRNQNYQKEINSQPNTVSRQVDSKNTMSSSNLISSERKQRKVKRKSSTSSTPTKNVYKGEKAFKKAKKITDYDPPSDKHSELQKKESNLNVLQFSPEGIYEAETSCLQDKIMRNSRVSSDLSLTVDQPNQKVGNNKNVKTLHNSFDKPNQYPPQTSISVDQTSGDYSTSAQQSSMVVGTQKGIFKSSIDVHHTTNSTENICEESDPNNCETSDEGEITSDQKLVARAQTNINVVDQAKEQLPVKFITQPTSTSLVSQEFALPEIQNVGVNSNPQTRDKRLFTPTQDSQLTPNPENQQQNDNVSSTAAPGSNSKQQQTTKQNNHNFIQSKLPMKSDHLLEERLINNKQSLQQSQTAKQSARTTPGSKLNSGNGTPRLTTDQQFNQQKPKKFISQQNALNSNESTRQSRENPNFHKSEVVEFQLSQRQYQQTPILTKKTGENLQNFSGLNRQLEDTHKPEQGGDTPDQLTYDQLLNPKFKQHRGRPYPTISGNYTQSASYPPKNVVQNSASFVKKISSSQHYQLSSQATDQQMTSNNHSNGAIAQAPLQQKDRFKQLMNFDMEKKLMQWKVQEDARELAKKDRLKSMKAQVGSSRADYGLKENKQKHNFYRDECSRSNSRTSPRGKTKLRVTFNLD